MPAALIPIENLTPGWTVTSLGNPAASFYPACWQTLPRTPWDLALFDGRLYLGLGNNSNRGPSANAGPVPLFAYDLKERRLPSFIHAHDMAAHDASLHSDLRISLQLGLFYTEPMLFG